MPRIYTTNAGDMWDSIAKSQMGNEFYANQLIDANFQYSNIVKFKAGVEVIIPDVIPLESAASLPPWRRNGRS